MILKKMFSRTWLFTTIIALIGSAVCVWLGLWQLDRLEQRRAFNLQVESMRTAELLDLNQESTVNISSMEWRSVIVRGKYDFANQIALRNQYSGDQYGYHLITPLLFDRGAVYVDRGWIPADGNTAPDDWRQYDELGQITIAGQIRLGRAKPVFGGVVDALPKDGGILFAWNNLNLEQIAAQLPYPILNVYIQPTVDAGDTIPPIPSQPVIEITEGPHFGYALQWFSFAVILFFGYPFYLRKQDLQT